MSVEHDPAENMTKRSQLAILEEDLQSRPKKAKTGPNFTKADESLAEFIHSSGCADPGRELLIEMLRVHAIDAPSTTDGESFDRLRTKLMMNRALATDLIAKLCSKVMNDIHDKGLDKQVPTWTDAKTKPVKAKSNGK